MKRSILLALVAALALAVGFSPSASAGVGGDAQISVKKGAKCAKGKGKAKGSASASAKGKKGRGCKPKGAGIADGVYRDAANNVELTLSGKGKTAVLKFEVPKFCLLYVHEGGPVPAKASGGGLQASETKTISLAGIPVLATWTLHVTKSLAYSLTASLQPEEGPVSCGFSGTIKGTLVKG